MSLLELLHNEKVVKLLELIDTDIKDIIEPSEKDNAIFLKIILIIETLLTNKKHQNSHIGKFFNRWYDKQPVIDEITEDLKMKQVKKKDIEYRIEEQIEKLKWEPVRLKDWIEESSYPIDKNNIEGFIFDKLKEKLIDKNKLNYNYGKEE